MLAKALISFTPCRVTPIACKKDTNYLHAENLLSSIPGNGTSHWSSKGTNIYVCRLISDSCGKMCNSHYNRPNKQSERRRRGGASDKLPRDLCSSIWDWFTCSDLKRCWQRVYCPHGCFSWGELILFTLQWGRPHSLPLNTGTVSSRAFSRSQMQTFLKCRPNGLSPCSSKIQTHSWQLLSEKPWEMHIRVT